jgi:hypothetical protein
MLDHSDLALHLWVQRQASVEDGRAEAAGGGQMTDPPAARPLTLSPGTAGQIGELYLEVRWPDGRRLDSRRKVSEHQARLLVENSVCEEVRSPTGILRFLRMRRNPPLKKFASLLADASITTTRTGNLHEHIESKRKGL